MTNGNYGRAKSSFENAYTSANDSSMKARIASVKNEQAEKISAIALEYFQQNNWWKAQELYNYAYFTCSEGYTNEREFQNNRNIVEKIKSMKPNNTVAVLTEVLAQANDPIINNIIASKLSVAKVQHVRAEAER